MKWRFKRPSLPSLMLGAVLFLICVWAVQAMLLPENMVGMLLLLAFC